MVEKNKLSCMIYKIFLLSLVLVYGCTNQPNKQEERAYAIALQVQAQVHADSLAEAATWRHTKLRANEGVFQVMQRLHISNATALRVTNILRFNVELVNLKSGERFAAQFAPATSQTAQLLEFQYRPTPILLHRILIDTTTNELTYVCQKESTEIHHRLITGDLSKSSSLDQALLGAGIPSNITQVVNGILMCKISFRTDARTEDVFTVLLQEEYYQHKIIPEKTKVLFVTYKGKRTGSHKAYRYNEPQNPQSAYNAHYTPDGQALIFTGLRYPLDKLHISSGYGRRIHPVTGRRTMHYGVDYTGRVGTPVYAVATGKVILSSRDRFSGNKVAIRHADGSTSYYLHLNRRKVRNGQRVRTKQIIGTVGRTGRVTGPHLHFGFKKKNGKWMNPRKKRMIATPRLSGERLVNFKLQIQHIREIYAHTTGASHNITAL